MADDKNREPNSGPALYYVLLFLPVILGIVWYVFHQPKKPDSGSVNKASLSSKEAPGAKVANPSTQDNAKINDSQNKKLHSKPLKDKNSK